MGQGHQGWQPKDRAVRRALVTSVLAFAALAVVPIAHAGDYPDHPIRFIVPFAAGGGTDIMARQIANRLSPILGQPIVVDNRPGAATIVGTQATVTSPPDGYTIMQGSASLAITPSLHKKLPYVALRDLAPIILTSTQAYVLVVPKNSPFRTASDVVAYAKANPGKLSFASPGAGSGGHLAGELFKFVTGIDMVHVPYRGDSMGLADVIAGHVQLMFGTISPSLPMVEAGQLRAIGVSTKQRVAQLPDVPAINESVPGYESSSWNGILAPAGTPRPIIDRLNREVQAIIQTPEMQAWYRKDGAEPGGGTPEDFAELIRSNTEKWATVVEKMKIEMP